MATSLSNLQSRFLRKITDYAFDDMSVANRNSTLYGYIESCIPKFYQCSSSLSVVEPDGESEYFSANGTSVTFVFSSTPTPSGDYEVIVTVTGVEQTEVTDYTYASATKTITFVTAPVSGSDNVMIEWEAYGQFSAALTTLEEEILANMMVLEWISEKVHHSDLLEQTLGTRDFQLYSQANHLKELRELEDKIERKVDKLIVNYTYYGGDLEELR